MGPKWILARARQHFASADYAVVDWDMVLRFALSPTKSGRPINHLSAHAAVCILRQVEKEYCQDRDRVVALIDEAIRILSEEMQ